jgi:MYXO-CTERM domain-containing protein
MKIILTVLTAAALATAAQADVFSDDFNAENGGAEALNYNGLTNWTVTNGTIDLIGNGGTFDFLPGNGLYIDLDGSSLDAGDMMSMSLFLTPGTYTLTYDLAGSQRSGSPVDAVDVTFGNAATVNHVLGYSQGFTNYSISMTVVSGGNYTILFQDLGNDNQGALLDNVHVTVPAPGAAAMLGVGMLASSRRRRV